MTSWVALVPLQGVLADTIGVAAEMKNLPYLAPLRRSSPCFVPFFGLIRGLFARDGDIVTESGMCRWPSSYSRLCV